MPTPMWVMGIFASLSSTNLYSPYAHTEEGEAAQENENVRQSQASLQQHTRKPAHTTLKKIQIIIFVSPDNCIHIYKTQAYMFFFKS